MSETIAILKGCGAVVLDEDAISNAEDDESMACIVLDIAQRDIIVADIERRIGEDQVNRPVRDARKVRQAIALVDLVEGQRVRIVHGGPGMGLG